MGKLSTGEWRLFLLSDCIKYYPDVVEFTQDLSRAGKDEVLQITHDDTRQLNELIAQEEVPNIRQHILAEWEFTNQVKDNGKGNKTICEYCQVQHIRYRYLCKNKLTNVWLSLGSVCVGNVIYGEERMRNKDFASEFVDKLEKMKPTKTKPSPEVPVKSNIEKIREEQAPVIKKCVQFLRYNCGYMDSGFLKGLEDKWHQGKALKPEDLDRLVRWCKKEKNKMLNKAQ
jgi:hypothetical protein